MWQNNVKQDGLILWITPFKKIKMPILKKKKNLGNRLFTSIKSFLKAHQNSQKIQLKDKKLGNIITF